MLAKEIKQGVLFTIVTMLLLGGVYNALLWGIGRVAFADQAEGSLLRRPDGTVIGSRLVAQKFTKPEYFHPRPSGVDYNAASTGGTNYGPSNPEHLKTVQERLDAFMKEEHVTAQQVPSEMVTASGGGMDPHIPPAAADPAGAARRVGAARRRRADQGSHPGPHRASDARIPGPRPRQRARAESRARSGAAPFVVSCDPVRQRIRTWQNLYKRPHFVRTPARRRRPSASGSGSRSGIRASSGRRSSMRCGSSIRGSSSRIP